MSVQVADVLERAAARIERDGLARSGWFYDGSRWPGKRRLSQIGIGRVIRLASPPCCVTGALLAESGSAFGISLTARRVFQRHSGVRFITEWSDHTPQAEVVAALRAAAEAERAS